MTAIVTSDRILQQELTESLRAARHAVVPLDADGNARALLGEYPWDIAVIDAGDRTATLCAQLRTVDAFRGRFLVAFARTSDETVASLDSGADEALRKPVDTRELLARLRAAERLVDVKKGLLLAYEKLERLAITDGLTGLYNHRYLHEQLAVAFRRASDGGGPLSVAMIDVDHFKRVNDRHGHGIGDAVLVELSNILVQSIRSTDLLGRYGGEEFALIMPGVSLDDAAGAVRRIRATIAATPIETDAGALHVTVSIGVTGIPHEDVASAPQFFKAADDALYRAKRQGRNRVAVGGRRAVVTRRRAHAAVEKI